MAICLGKKWEKLRNAWKCWFLDSLSRKITFELFRLKYEIWFKETFNKANDMMPGNLTLFSHDHDQNSGSGSRGLDDEFSGREC